MKVIFLDFNGVLDTYEQLDIIDQENLNILIEVARKTNAKIVITSSIKRTFLYTGHHSRIMKYLMQTLLENDLEIYGITPNLDTRAEEIKEYLKHHPEITNYCILDDDYYFNSMSRHMVKLPSQQTGGNGLKEINKNKIIKVLKRRKSISMMEKI